MRRLSRRQFNALGAAAVAAPLGWQGKAPIAAAAVIERIQKNIGVEWKPETVDTIKAGEPATIVSGIVTTAMATMDVLRKAVDARANMVITCEPTFFSRNDGREPPVGRGGGREAPSPPATPPLPDRIYAAKNAFIEKHGLVIVRLSQHWRMRRPDPFVEGLARTLGWTRRPDAAGPGYSVSAASLRNLARDVKKALGARGGIRVIGDPQMRVETAALVPGSTPIATALEVVPTVDVMVAGEVREWESVEYARDVAFSGQRKGLMLIGRVVSEEGGMAECARWLGPLVPEVPVRHVAAGDPYWRPA